MASALDVHPEGEGKGNGKGRHHEPFDLILHFFIMTASGQFVCQIEVSSCNHSQGKYGDHVRLI